MRPKQRRHFRAGLGEAEDVVDEEQHVLAFDVAEIFGLGQARQSDAGAGARRLVHLAEHQGDLRALGGRVAVLVLGDDPGVEELVIEVVALAGALADAGEHGNAAMALGDIVDQLLDEHGLAHPGAAEQADLAALGVRREEVDDLDPGDEDGGFGRLVDERRGVGVDRGELVASDRALLVDRLADDVHDPAERLGADRDLDLVAGRAHLLAAGQALGRIHGDGADDILAEVLGDLEHQAVAVVFGLERREDRGEVAIKGHIDHGADHLGDAAGDVAGRGGRLGSGLRGRGLFRGGGLLAGLDVGGGGHVVSSLPLCVS